MKLESKIVGTRITEKLLDRMHKAMEAGPWLNDSDFFRDAIRHKLDQLDRDSELKEKV